jgi:RecB family endonuclease NucS
MPGAEEVYRLIRQVAPSFAAKLQSAAAASHNETELRTQVAHHIQELADQFGVRLNLREEYTLAEGQADAVYNRLVIEYKTPGVLRADLSHEKTAAAVAQMRRYVDGLAREQRHAAERMLGVAIDGHYLVFARYVQGHWSVEAPLAVTAQSSAR